MPTHDVTLQRTKTTRQARVMGVAPEEFGIERNARTIKDCNYCFHKIPTQTEADLIAQGYDEKQVKKLPSYSFQNNTEELARDTADEEYSSGGKSNSGTRIVEVTEHYIRLDYEGDGKPCLYKITTAGGQDDVLLKDGKPDIEEFDAIPFAAATPVPVTHRFFGRSIADLVMDIQRIKTALLRGLLDNTYMVTTPRVEVGEEGASDNTLDDLMVSRPNGIIRTKRVGSIAWQQVPSVGAAVYPALEYMDSTREMRTGVTRVGQGVDANALQNQTATAASQVFTMAQARMKLIVRIIAETGIKDMFALLHQVIRKHGQEAQTVRLRNKWVSVDPREWKARNDMTINVGLGNGGRAERFAQTMALANVQKELLLGGKSNIVGDQQLYNSAADLARLAGHKNPDQFFNDPTEKDPQTGQLLHPPAPPAQDPAMIKAQADMQVQAQKGQLEAQKSQADTQHQIAKTQAEMALADKKFELEKQLKLLEAELKVKQHEMDMQKHHAEMQSKVDGAQMDERIATRKMKMDAGVKLAGSGLTVNEDGNPTLAPAVGDIMKQHVQHHVQTIQDLHAQNQELHAQHQQLHAEHSAPVEFIRDPKGKLVGAKKGKRTIKIIRDNAGRAVGAA